MARGPAIIIVALVATLAVFAGACSDETDDDSATARVVAMLAALPERAGPRTETTYSVPHVQVFVDPVADVDAELRRRIYSLPGIEDRDTIVAFTGTKALWLADDFEPSDLVATIREREFAHIHPDGSLHAVLPLDRALDATSTRWAELHPWVGREDFWDGMVMLYTPQNFEELETTWQLIVDSYNFVTGQNLTAGDFVTS